MWRAMASLLVLRDQVNALAPDRSRASDGLVGDAAHQATNSDHNPHYVPGVGYNIVTALDLTHDPVHGFDSYEYAEVLRTHRDRRIKYVISNHRIFSSYTSGSRPAWTWGPYKGVDPHTNHVHVSVLDSPISDTRTPWNLEGTGMADYTEAELKAFPWQYTGRGIGENNGTTVQRSTLSYFDEILQLVRKIAAAVPPDLVARLDAILAAAQDDTNVDVVLPPDAIQDLQEIKDAIAAVPKAVLDEEAARLAS
jgi:hypothetical protein